MRDLTRAEIEAWREHPEQGSLRMSPQFLLEMLDSEWHKPDGSIVTITGVGQWPDGEIAILFHTTYPEKKEPRDDRRA